MNASEPEEIVSFTCPMTPVGSLKFGARLSDTAGTGFGSFRVYGMYALVLVLEGGAGRYRDTLGTNRRVGPGDLIVVFPDVPHQYGPEAGDVWEEIFVTFDGPSFDAWRYSGLDPASPVWSLASLADWEKRFWDVLQLTVTNRTQACSAAALVHQMISDALGERAMPNGFEPWLETACNALGAGAGAPSLQEIATNSGRGYEAFRKTFRAAIGESPAKYRRRMRLAQAALMLQRLDLSLEMIASTLGFCDAFHLSKAFKLHYGYPPAELRRQGSR